MNTVEDFKNAPVGATATYKVTGGRAMKVDDGDQYWITLWGSCLSDVQMALCDYTLDPTVPATAREALDLTWELAHPVKEGQTIPKGTHILRLVEGVVRVFQNSWDFDEIAPLDLPYIRTLEPLLDPEPDWLDAPAVIATTRWCDTELWLPETGGYYWECAHCDDVRFWSDLTDVTPLYPKEV